MTENFIFLFHIVLIHYCVIINFGVRIGKLAGKWYEDPPEEVYAAENPLPFLVVLYIIQILVFLVLKL